MLVGLGRMEVGPVDADQSTCAQLDAPCCWERIPQGKVPDSMWKLRSILRFGQMHFLTHVGST
jgi:hypothetical protein